MNQNGEKWVEKARKGSKKAFDKVVRRFTPLIFRFLYDLTGNYEDAQDLTQDTFMKAYVKLKTYRGEAAFSTWLYSIAYHTGIDFLRGGKVMRPLHPGDEEKMTVDAPPERFPDEREAIEKSLRSLSIPQRTAVVLHYYHDMRMREIAGVLGCSESTVRVHLYRALNHLRKTLKDFAPGEQ